MSRIKQYRPTPAMVVALVALVFAMSGWATAQIPNPLPLQDAPQVQVRTADGTGFANVDCPTGWVATGGGGFAGIGGVLDVSQPVPPFDGETPTGWNVTSDTNTFVRAYAVCMRVR